MAEEASDIFLTIELVGGGYLAGETLDRVMAGTGMELKSVEFSFGKATIKDGAEVGKLPTGKGGKPPSAEDINKVLEALQQNQRKLSKRAEKGGESEETYTFSISKYVDAATPGLLQAYNQMCFDPKYVFKSATVTTFRSGGGQHPYVRVTFGHVRLLSYKLQMAEPLPTEDLDFSFGQCQVEYWRQTTTGDYSLASTYPYDLFKKDVWDDAPKIPAKAK